MDSNELQTRIAPLRVDQQGASRSPSGVPKGPLLGCCNQSLIGLSPSVHSRIESGFESAGDKQIQAWLTRKYFYNFYIYLCMQENVTKSVTKMLQQDSFVEYEKDQHFKTHFCFAIKEFVDRVCSK